MAMDKFLGLTSFNISPMQSIWSLQKNCNIGGICIDGQLSRDTVIVKRALLMGLSKSLKTDPKVVKAMTQLDCQLTFKYFLKVHQGQFSWDTNPMKILVRAFMVPKVSFTPSHSVFFFCPRTLFR